MRTGVLVTGGAGFIGSHLVDTLIETGESVTVLDDLSTGSHDNLAFSEGSGKLRFVRGSVLDPSAVAEAMRGNRQVFHLAVQCVRRSLGNPLQSHEVNATGTINVLEEARRQAVDRFVYCSSSEVYGNISTGLLNEENTPCRPVTVYGAAKLAGELYTEAYHQTYGMSTIIVRPFNAYGPRAHESGDLAEVIPRFMIRVLNGMAPVVFGDGLNGRDFTHVTDVARGLRLAGACDALVGKRVNIAYGSMVTVGEIAAMVMRACGRNDLAIEYGDPRPGDVHVLSADTRHAAETLGYRADISIEKGIADYLEWFRSSHPDPSVLLEDEVENWQMPECRKVRS